MEWDGGEEWWKFTKAKAKITEEKTSFVLCGHICAGKIWVHNETNCSKIRATVHIVYF